MKRSSSEGRLDPKMFATRPPSRSRYTAIILAAVVGTLATVGAFLLVCSWEYRVATIDFQSRAKSYLEFMNADLGEASAVMRSIAAFIGSNNHAVSADEFARFSAASREQVSALRDTAWAPRVTLAERPAFERDARAAGIVAYQIKQFGEHGHLFPALPRPEYYALLYNEPERVAEDSLIGLDLVFEKRRAARSLSIGSRPSSLRN
jgi:CHASE1-domain containing sensor protein